jgi:hypothetical protein
MAPGLRASLSRIMSPGFPLWSVPLCFVGYVSCDSFRESFLVKILGNMWFLQAPAPVVINSGRGWEHAGIPGACTGSYEAARSPAFSLSPTLEEMCLCLQKSCG